MKENKARMKVAEIGDKLANLLIHWTVHTHKQQYQSLHSHKKQNISYTIDLLFASVENN